MLHYQMESDSPGGATSNSKVHELGYYSHLHFVVCQVFGKMQAYCWIFATMQSGLTFFGSPCTVYSEWQLSCSKRPIEEIVKVKVFISRSFRGSDVEAEAESSGPRRERGNKNCLEVSRGETIASRTTSLMITGHTTPKCAMATWPSPLQRPYPWYRLLLHYFFSFISIPRPKFCSSFDITKLTSNFSENTGIYSRRLPKFGGRLVPSNPPSKAPFYVASASRC